MKKILIGCAMSLLTAPVFADTVSGLSADAATTVQQQVIARQITEHNAKVYYILNTRPATHNTMPSEDDIQMPIPAPKDPFQKAAPISED
jgi:uncharacterized protein YdeI (BOF family)